LKLNILRNSFTASRAPQSSGPGYYGTGSPPQAAALFSSGVADALEYLRVTKHPDFIGCEATIEFIRKVDQIFDILNSRTIFAKGFKQPLKISNRSCWQNQLEEGVKYFRSLKIENIDILNHPRKTFALGFITAIKSVISVALKMLYRPNNPLQYLLTYKLSQDHIELLFSCIRARSGSNNNPNSNQFKYALRKLLFRNSVTASSSANVVSFDSNPQCTIFNFRSEKRSLINVTEETDNDEALQIFCEFLDKKPLSDLAQNVLYYIAGFVVRHVSKNLNCEECLKILLFENKNLEHSYSNYGSKYMAFTRVVSRGGLIHVSPGVFLVIEYAEQCLRHIFKCNTKWQTLKLSEIISNNVLFKFINEYRNRNAQKLWFAHSVNVNLDEELHSTQLIKAIVSKYIDVVRLHSLARVESLKLHFNSSTIRQKLNKLILFANA
jgi:hypothetical protein